MIDNERVITDKNIKSNKHIEEMAYEMTQYKGKMCERIEHNNCLLKFHTNAFIDCNYCKLAEHLITEKGYRKASDVIDEFAERLKLTAFEMDMYENSFLAIEVADIDRIANEMKGEGK